MCAYSVRIIRRWHLIKSRFWGLALSAILGHIHRNLTDELYDIDVNLNSKVSINILFNHNSIDRNGYNVIFNITNNLYGIVSYPFLVFTLTCDLLLACQLVCVKWNLHCMGRRWILRCECAWIFQVGGAPLGRLDHVHLSHLSGNKYSTVLNQQY